MSEIVLRVSTGEAGFQPDPKAWAPCKVERVEKISTRVGEALRIWVSHPEWAGAWGFVLSPRLSKKSRLGQLVQAAGFTLTPGTEFSLGQLKEREVGIVVYKDAKGWARPASFFPSSSVPF